MNRAEFEADLVKKAGTGGKILTTELVLKIGSVRHYVANVFTVGKDATDASETSQVRNVHFYVDDEGGPGEIARPQNEVFKSPDDRAPTGSELENVSKIFASPSLRGRVIGAMLIAARAIQFEGAKPNHAARVTLSGVVILNPGQFVNAFMYVLSTDAGVQTTGVKTDNAVIQNLVNGFWDYIAETQGFKV